MLREDVQQFTDNLLKTPMMIKQDVVCMVERTSLVCSRE